MESDNIYSILIYLFIEHLTLDSDLGDAFDWLDDNWTGDKYPDYEEVELSFEIAMDLKGVGK